MTASWYVCREPTRRTLFVWDNDQAARNGCALAGQRGFESEVIAGPFDRDEAFAEYQRLVAEESHRGTYWSAVRETAA